MPTTTFRTGALIHVLRQIAAYAKQEHEQLFTHDRAQTDYKTDGTPVSRVDITVNELLRDFAHEHNLGYVGEEGNGALDREYVLYVDSIDGTTAYLRGMNTATIIVSLMHMQENWGTPVLGVIIEPLSGRLWIGENHYTTFIDGPSCPSARVLKLDKNTPERIKTNICVFPGASHNLAKISQRIIAHTRFDDQQMGAFGISGGLIASGILHAAAIARTAAVESAAMLPIVLGAGGAASDLEGNTLARFEFGEVRGKPDFTLPNGALFAANEDIFNIVFDQVLAVNHPLSLV